jgi:hypothetical protein
LFTLETKNIPIPMETEQANELLSRLARLENQVATNNTTTNTLIKIVLYTSSEDYTAQKKHKFESTIAKSLELIDILAESNNRSVVKRIVAHPLVTTTLSLVISIMIVIGLQYFNSAQIDRLSNSWFHLNGAIVFTPLLTTILGLFINQVVTSIKYSLTQEDNMLYLKLKQAIDESAKEQRIEREISLEKERLAREASTEKERLAREASTEKERLAREASTEKERLAREASTEKERTDREAAITRETDSRIKNEIQHRESMERFRTSIEELSRQVGLLLNSK